MEAVLLVAMLAIVVEGFVEYVKEMYAKAGFAAPAWLIQLAALVVAVVLALLTGADIFSGLGVAFKYPIVGSLLTGLFMSRGSNYLSDLIGRLRGSGDLMIDETTLNLKEK